MATIPGSKRLLDISGNNISTAVSLEASGTLLDVNGVAGTSGQVLSSTGSTVDWVDPSTVIGGPYVTIGTAQTITGAKTFSTVLTATNFAASTDSGINVNGITLTRIAANSAIRVGDGLETLGLLRSYAGLNVATWAVVGQDVTVGTLSTQAHRTISILTAAESNSILKYRESTNNYGFTTQYHGTGNYFELLRHDNSVGGNTVYRVGRASDDITFYGNIILANTGRIQGIDTVSAGTDAANKAYVDASVPSLANYVTLTTAQTISGAKTFSETVKLKSAWDSTALTNNSFYVQNSTDGFGMGIGTSISTWWSWDSSAGQKRAIDVQNDGTLITLGSGGANVTVTNDLTVSGGDITLGGTGRIQGVDTVSAGTDAANRTYVDTKVASVSGSTTISSTGGTTPVISAITGTVNSSSSILATGTQIQSAIDTAVSTIPSGLAFEGNWNAATDTPTLSGTTQDNGKFWIVTVAGSTSLSGITDWEIGDWAIYVDNGAGTDAWQKVDNSSTLSGLGVANKVAFWSTTSNVTYNSNFSYDGTNLTVPRLRVGDGTDGYFYSDSGGRTAFNGGDFYIQNGVSNYYNYATTQFHGGTSGDSHLFRGNSLSGNHWSIGTTGIITAPGGTSTEWNTAYDNSITAAAVTGTTTKTLTLTQQDAGTITTSWTDNNDNTNWYVNAATFNTGNGIITGTGTGSAGFTVDIDGRYLPLAGGTMANTNLVTNMNADLLDGISSASFLRSDAVDISTQRITFSANATNNWDTIATASGSQGSIEVFNTGAGNDAFMAFHAGNDYAFYFGIDADNNQLSVGGWSMGANKYKVWNESNDGAGSGLDADLLDGQQGSYYVNTSTAQVISGTKTINTLVIGTSAKIQFQNNDFIRYDDAANRFHFDVDGGTSNASVQAATFVGALTGPAATITGNLNVNGNTFLGNADGDYTHINDILHVGATDSGDADFYFGEGSSGAIAYGVHWDWDSGYTFTWNTRNNNTDTALMSYMTNDTSKVQWFRNFDMNNNKITELATPTATTDAANKAYVDAAVAGVPVGDITGVTAGAGMTGGGTSGTVTLNVIGGDGITANANDIEVDSTVVRTSGAQTIAGNKKFTAQVEVEVNGGAILRLHDPGDNSWKLKGDANFHIYDDSNSDYLTILNSGNVGIGTTSPGALLQVGGSTNSSGSFGSFNIAGSYGIDSWARFYAVSTTNILSILQADGTALQNGGAYRVTGHIDGTGTDQSSRAVFWNQNGTWFCNLTGASGTSSNSILFLVDATTGLPSVKTYHPNNYNVRVWHERINLNEGIGTDNSRHYFGADAYMTQINNDISMFTTAYSGNGAAGKLGIGVAQGTQKLHVVGNARVTGAYYDSNNSPGTSGQVLSSTATGTDWVTSAADANYYTTTATFNTGNGIISFSGAGGQPAYSVDIDNRYLPLAGGIMSGKIGRSTAIVGFLEGSYNNVGDNSANSNPIYTIGSSYNPASTTLGNMYGIGYTHAGNASFVSLTGASSWGLYVAADGDARIFLSGSNGNISTVGAIYASGGNSTEWNTAYDNNLRWSGTATGLTASTGRTSLGGTTIGQNMFTLTNPGAITFPRFNAANTVSALSAADFRTAIGAGTSSSSGVTSINFKTDGTALNVSSNTITGIGTMTGIWQGSAAQYVNGLGDLTTFPSIPQGDITGVTAGTGLSGGGTSGTVTLALDLGELAVGGTLIATDYLIAENGGVDNRQLISSIPLSIFNNNSSWTSNTGTTTASNTQTFTNKSGNISMWTNDSNYITSASLPTVNNGTLTMSTSAGLDGAATFTANQSGNSTFAVTLDLNELGAGGTLVGTDSLVAVNGTVSNKQLISSIPLSIFNNNAGWTSNTGDITSVTAGTNLNGGGTSGAVTLNLDAAIELTSVQYGSGVTLSESSDRADLLYINSSTSGWGGLQIGNTSNEFIFSLMGDGSTGGIYDDQNSDWIIQWSENSEVRLYHNAVEKLNTSAAGVTVTGDLIVTGGDITLNGTGRIQGVDTVSATTDAANKAYVDAVNVGVTQITAGTNVTISPAGGTGNVTINAAGGGGIGGSTTATEIAFGSATASEIDSDPGLTYTSGNGLTVGDTTGSGNSSISMKKGSAGQCRFQMQEGTTTKFDIKLDNVEDTYMTASNTLTLNTTGTTKHIILDPTGNVGIDNTAPTYKLDVTGTGRFTSTVTATNFILSSDKRLKDNIKNIDNDHIDVDWKNFELKSEPGIKRSGVIAQELEEKHPEFVRTDKEGLKSVAYIDLLIAKIAELEARLEKAGI